MENNIHKLIEQKIILDNNKIKHKAELHSLEVTLSIMKQYGCDSDNINKITKVYNQYKNKLDNIQEELQECTNKINDIQNKCLHENVEYLWHDSHHDYYQCKICNKILSY